MGRIQLATRRWPTRLALTSAALGVAALLVLEERERRQTLSELEAILATYGVSERQPDVLRNLEREPDPHHAELLAGRALLADALETDASQVLSRFGQFPAAQELAERALLHRPAAWQGFLLLGGARYLERSVAQERALITAATEWEYPLEIADQLGPAQAEARRFLTMAYLELWPFLSPEKEERTRAWLSESFRDPATFDRTISPWLAVAADLDEALDPLPDEVFVWQRVESLLGQQKLWDYWVEAWARGRVALRRQLESMLAEGQARVEGGDLRRGRPLVLLAATQSPPEAGWRDHFEAAFSSVPAGLFTQDAAGQLARWLDWELDRCLYSECQLPPSTTERLAGAISDLPAAVEARVALVKGDLALAEQVERRRGAESPADWAPYYVKKAEALLQRGEVAAARRALGTVPPEWRVSPLFTRASRSVAEFSADGASSDQAAQEWSDHEQTRWRPVQWRTQRGPAGGYPFIRLELVAAKRAPGLEIDLVGEPRDGVIQVLLDGASLGAFALPAEGPLVISRELTPGLHTLDVVPLGGRAPALGGVSLR